MTWVVVNLLHPIIHDKLKKLKKKQIYELVDVLYTAKAKNNPMTHYMNGQLDQQTLLYLLQHPSLFTSQTLYYDFVQKYFPDLVQRHPHVTQALIQVWMMNANRRRQQQQYQHMYELNFKRVNNDIQHRKTKKIPDNLNVNIQLNNILNDTTKKMTDEHKKQLDYQLDRIQKDLDKISKDGLIKNTNINNNPEIQKLRKKHQQQIQRQNKRIEKNKENRVKWMTARLEENPPKYKVWQQTPNPKTRHTETDGQKVRLEEQFIVINDKTGDIDHVDYPGDWSCSASNAANCLCDITFTNDPTGYKPHNELNEDYKTKSEEIKQTNDNSKLFEFQNKYEEIYNIINDFEMLQDLNESLKHVSKKNIKKVPVRILLDSTLKDKVYQNLRSPKSVAQYFNLDYSFKNGQYYFEDKEHNVNIHFDKFYLNESNQNIMDTRNTGKGEYDLKEVIKIYSDAHPLLKDSANEIHFTTILKDNLGNINKSIRGQSDRWSKKIYIAQSAFNKYTNGNLRRTMYHEMGHTLDFSMSTTKQLKEKNYGISSSDSWNDALSKDEDYQKHLGFDTYQYSSAYGKKTKQDDFAETVSMVVQLGFIDKSDALITDENGNLLSSVEWEKYHPNKIKFVQKLLEKANKSQFIN